MREIDHAEDAEHEREPAGGKEDQQPVLQAVEDLDEDEFHMRRAWDALTLSTVVMPGLVPGIHVFIFRSAGKDMDGRDKPGHDAV